MKKIFRNIFDFFVIKYLGSPKLINAIKLRKNSFLTIISRPKLAENFSRQSDKMTTVPTFAVVIQGRSVGADSFTLETVKIYKKSFNNSIIIISTHEGADRPEDLKALEELGAKIVVSPRPSNNGPFNINLQITSSVAGLKEAKRLGFNYAIKTRSDIRLYGVNVPEFLFNLIRQFPLKPLCQQKERIISTNIFTLKYRPYSLSDMTVAGSVEDLLLYFDVPLDEREKIIMTPNMSITDYVRERPGEIYLETEFLKKIDRKILGTIEDSWEVFANHFCVIDQQSLDSYWYKNDIYQHQENKFLNYGPEFGLQDLNFREWFNLYNRFGKD